MSKARFQGTQVIVLKGIQWWASKATAARLPKQVSVKVDLFSTDKDNPDVRRQRVISKVEATTGFRVKAARTLTAEEMGL